MPTKAAVKNEWRRLQCRLRGHIPVDSSYVIEPTRLMCRYVYCRRCSHVIEQYYEAYGV